LALRETSPKLRDALVTKLRRLRDERRLEEAEHNLRGSVITGTLYTKVRFHENIHPVGACLPKRNKMAIARMIPQPL
jgi:hypothetical protein